MILLQSYSEQIKLNDKIEEERQASTYQCKAWPCKVLWKCTKKTCNAIDFFKEYHLKGNLELFFLSKSVSRTTTSRRKQSEPK